MIKLIWPSILLFGVVSFVFAGLIPAAPQDAKPGGVMLPTVNGAPFTSGPVTVDNAHCGWNYVLGGGAFYAAQVPSASGFPVGCRITITNADPLPTGSNATGAKWITVGGIHGCQPTDWEGTYLYPLQTMEVTVVASDHMANHAMPQSLANTVRQSICSELGSRQRFR